MHTLSLGVVYLGDGRCRFQVWAPRAGRVDIRIMAPRERMVPMVRDELGYHRAVAEGVEPGSLYYYLLDGGKERPDPASRCQPEGVHGPSRVVDTHAFSWSDNCWSGLARQSLIFYELHVGTFTPEGTFTAIIPRLDELRDLGVNAVEIMPIAQFPGNRNWGYDGVFPFAAQNSYGGPEELQRLVDACHKKGMALILDVVYNHLGPEGNYLADFGPYFTDRYTGPWGPMLNFDGPGSDEVRRFFIENALYWLAEFHVDGLRLDAVHAIKDFSARPFLEELNNAAHRQSEHLGRRVHIIAESDLNDARVIHPPVIGGYGLDAQWCDDFHHSLHTLLTGEHQGYYQDFGRLEHFARSFAEGYTYTGQYSPFRRRRHGNFPRLCPASQFVVYAQNHDQVGNRAGGEKLTVLTTFDGLKLAACAVLLSPFLPMLFMGEEYGETAPFLYFTSHTSPELSEAVRRGRREEFAGFDWAGEVPDPQDKETFLRSRLNYDLRLEGRHSILYQFYRQLIRMRRDLPALAELNKDNLELAAMENEQVLFVRRRHCDDEVNIVFSFNNEAVTVSLPVPEGHWGKILDTAEEQWLGSGSTVPVNFESSGEIKIVLLPKTCVLFRKIKVDNR